MRAFFLTFWNWKSSFWILSLSAVGWLALPQMSLSILLPPLLTAPWADCIMLAADMTPTTAVVMLLGLSVCRVDALHRTVQHTHNGRSLA